MGRRGAAPRPTALKLLAGERDSRRLNRAEPVPRDVRPEKPENLSPEVSAVWDRMMAELEYMNIVRAVDGHALHCYCEAVVTHQRASELVGKSDVLIKGIHGGPVRNPALAVQRDAAHTVRQFAQEFGLTPSARSRIEVRGAADGDNPFAVGQ